MISEKVAPALVAENARAFRPRRDLRRDRAVHQQRRRCCSSPDRRCSSSGSWRSLTFLITGAFVTAQLGRMFPEEGSLYVWTHKVLGPLLGVLRRLRRVVARADLCWCSSGSCSRTSSSSSPCSSKPSCEFPCLFTENWQIGVVVLVVIWFSALMSYLKMRVTQNYVNVLFWFYAAAIFLIGFAGVWWLLQGNAASTDFGTGWDPFQGESLALASPRTSRSSRSRSWRSWASRRRSTWAPR